MLEHFKIRTLLLVTLIILIITAIIYTILKHGFNTYLVILIPLLAIFIWRLFSLIDKTNQEVASFLANIKYNDYAASFPEKKSVGDSYQTLHGAFNLVTEKFRDIRSEKEAQFQYLQAIVENVDTGLICFDQSGKTMLINKGLQQLLRKSYFPNLKSVEKYNPALYEALEKIVPGEKQLLRIIVNGEILQLAIRKTILKLKNDELHLFAIHNIHKELEENEVTSWQKLIRILTHEIMNSVTPVISLASTTHDMMVDRTEINQEEFSDIRNAIQAIERRSSGLLNFTQNYRKLTKIPPPKFQELNVSEFINRVITLLKPQFKLQDIEIATQFPGHPIHAHFDPELMEQVFINLLNNAKDAVNGRENPKINVHVFRSMQGELEIQIQDNGAGIPSEIQEQIFIPFYTTKKEGSGIGLSLCRQIVHKHKGVLHVYSEPGKGSVFTIKF